MTELPEPSRATDPHRQVAAGFLEALTSREFDRLADYLDDEIRFRALLPPMELELIGPDAVIDKFRQWFGSRPEFAVLDTEIGQVGPRLSMRWRVRVRDEGGEQVVEQHAFLTVVERIVILDLLCSGFQAG
jgi:hypothetical protein